MVEQPRKGSISIVMSRWHEPGCKRPMVINLDNTPCCTHCFAFASVVQVTENTVPVTLQLKAASKRKHTDCDSLQLASDGKLSRNKSSNLFCDINPGEEFRLLKISSGTHSTSVHAFVEKASTRDPLCASYDIVSYTRFCGTFHEAEWRQIYIGQYWDVIFVPRQYEEAIQSVRHEKTDRHVWMECLCVDEADVEEKTCQTKLASRILRGASGTLMCLASEPVEEYDAAINVLSSLESFRPSPLDPNTSPTPGQSRALKSLMKHDYFSTIQAVREVVFSKSLRVIYKRRAVPWTDVLSTYVISNASAPLWLQGPAFRYNQTARDTLSLLLEVSTYLCRDKRDKIFVLLDLFHMDGVTADYEMRIEKVFTDVATYFVRYGLLNEMIHIAAMTQRQLPDVPSWAPDWGASSQLGLNFRWMARKGCKDTDAADEVRDGVKPIKFLHSDENAPEIFTDAADGRLTIRMANRLCTIRDAIIDRHATFTKIQIDAGAVGTLVITCNASHYEPGFSDFLYLLPMMSVPVILRYSPLHNAYSLIGTCTVGRGSPIIKEDNLVIPWRDPTIGKGVINVSVATQDELDLRREFYTNLKSICRMHSDMPQQDPSIARSPPARVESLLGDFALLSVIGLLELEATLRDSWNQLDQELGWIFLDQHTLPLLLLEIHQGDHEPSTGHGTLAYTKEYFEGCGLGIPWQYDWDLSAFCRSFATRTIIAPPPEDQYQSPMLSLLKLRLPEIRRWAMISAQLLLLFDYSRFALKASWPEFPGSPLTEKWCTVGQSSYDDIGLKSRAGHHEWDWSEFRAALQLRATIWSYPIPPRLRLSVNTNLATQLALRFLGLNLSHQEDIVIE